MAVRIRLTRLGKKKQPTYRVVVADGRSPRDGRYIEQIGRYDPRQEPSVIEIDQERASYWLSRGAQPSDPVRRLLEVVGVVAAPAPAAPAAPVAEAGAAGLRIHIVGEEAQLAAAAEEAAAGEDAAVGEEAAAGQWVDEGAGEASEEEQ
jgi:small subunit ribosomal protein S16